MHCEQRTHSRPSKGFARHRKTETTHMTRRRASPELLSALLRPGIAQREHISSLVAELTRAELRDLVASIFDDANPIDRSNLLDQVALITEIRRRRPASCR